MRTQDLLIADNNNTRRVLADAQPFIDEALRSSFVFTPAAHGTTKENFTPSVADESFSLACSAHGLTLVTRNTSDYPQEVPLLNPWDG